jgi:putative tricarboxylic transport membrane protein
MVHNTAMLTYAYPLRPLLCTAAAAVAFAAHGATPEWQPKSAVEIMVASGPGGGMDRTARTIQAIVRDKKMADLMVNVVNKAGGGGTIGWTYLSQHPHDAHFLAIGSPALLTNHIMGKSALSQADFTPLAMLISEYTAFAVSTNSPIKTAKDLIARLRADPRSVSIAISTSIGSGNHVAIGKVGKAAGVDITKLRLVIFNATGEAITAVIGGHVDLVPATASSVLPYALGKQGAQGKQGGLSIIAIAAPQRAAGALADVPTWREQGVNVVQDSFRAVVGAKDLTAAQIAYWDNVFGALARSPAWTKDVEDNYCVSNYQPAAEAAKYLAAQYTDFKDELKALGVVK